MKASIDPPYDNTEEEVMKGTDLIDDTDRNLLASVSSLIPESFRVVEATVTVRENSFVRPC